MKLTKLAERRTREEVGCPEFPCSAIRFVLRSVFRGTGELTTWIVRD
jgi:hypothetical protein